MITIQLFCRLITKGTSVTFPALLVTSFILYGCDKEVDLSIIIDDHEPLFITQQINMNQVDASLTVHRDSIMPNSGKWNQLIAWGEKNNSGWERDIASRICQAYLRQRELTLCFDKGGDFAVIMYNHNNKGRQLIKKIDKGSLDFVLTGY